MTRRLAYILLLLTTALLSCTDTGERTAEVWHEATVESLADGEGSDAVLSGDDRQLTSMAMQGETVSVPTGVSTPAAFHGTPCSKQVRSHHSPLRMTPSARSASQARRHHLPIVFAKAGTAFVSTRAANYYVFALMRMLC